MVSTPAQYAQLAYEKLLLHGRTITVTVYTDSYSPATGANTQSTTNYSVVSSPLLSYEDRYIQSDLIKIGDAYVIIPAHNLAFTPAIGNTITVDSVVWRILSVKPYTYQTGVVAYECQARKI